MVRWRVQYLRVAVTLGALAGLLIGSGAGVRWG
jgi:hypothetical protein